MADSDKDKTPDWIRLSPELEHFNPYEGLVDFRDKKIRNIRYGYKICNMNILFDQSIPGEIASKYTVYPIPNTPKWIRGLINHRGNLIPVFNLYYLWSIDKPQEELPLMIFDRNEKSIGIYVDAYPLALEIDDATTISSSIPDSIPHEMKEFINSSHKITNTHWYEVNLNGFMKYITRDFSDDNSELSSN